jgi:hypothetical protein
MMVIMFVLPHFLRQVTPFSLKFLCSSNALLQKYALLMCSAPADDFDCSDLYDAHLLLNAVAHAAAQQSGCLHILVFLLVSCSHTIFSYHRLYQKYQHEPQRVDVNCRSGASAEPAALSRPSAREHVRQPPPWHCRCHSNCIFACWCVEWAGACARLRLEERVVIAAAGDIKSINVSECGLNGLLPTSIIARLLYL